MKNGNSNTRVTRKQLTEEPYRVSGTRGIGPTAQQEIQRMWIKIEEGVVSDHITLSTLKDEKEGLLTLAEGEK